MFAKIKLKRKKKDINKNTKRKITGKITVPNSSNFEFGSTTSTNNKNGKSEAIKRYKNSKNFF